MRSDFECIQRWVKPQTRVLDLGCGDGTLLSYLSEDRAVQGYGLEINPHNIAECVKRGVNVIEQDLDKGLKNFSDNSFDTVVMTQALQAVHYPDLILDEMLRVGRECIVTFPNFGHWRCRGYLGWRGRMPVSKFMPYTWYNTPNIHFCTFKDFEALCFQKNLHILDRLVVDQTHQGHWLGKISPNLFGEIAIYHLTR
ncbi:methionine biosynthesis protein MetW [Aestuariirhabdus sp. LZHN29]|uniref:methionine biosynthesis protein MetW n=1 Tax=Aestuariirhabdus sp. LZHN29 TaxID=3417462 RepID=UPI003CE9D3D8